LTTILTVVVGRRGREEERGGGGGRVAAAAAFIYLVASQHSNSILPIHAVISEHKSQECMPRVSPIRKQLSFLFFFTGECTCVP